MEVNCRAGLYPALHIIDWTATVVKIEQLISALDETITLLRKSQSSIWMNMPVEEIIQNLESEIAKAKDIQSIDSELLGLLFAPTGPIQEAAIANGWTEDYLKMTEIVDQFTIEQ